MKAILSILYILTFIMTIFADDIPKWATLCWILNALINLNNN